MQILRRAYAETDIARRSGNSIARFKDEEEKEKTREGPEEQPSSSLVRWFFL
jgi:hypothetical protein